MMYPELYKELTKVTDQGNCPPPLHTPSHCTLTPHTHTHTHTHTIHKSTQSPQTDMMGEIAPSYTRN